MVKKKKGQEKKVTKKAGKGFGREGKGPYTLLAQPPRGPNPS